MKLNAKTQSFIAKLAKESILIFFKVFQKQSVSVNLSQHKFIQKKLCESLCKFLSIKNYVTMCLKIKLYNTPKVPSRGQSFFKLFTLSFFPIESYNFEGFTIAFLAEILGDFALKIKIYVTMCLEKKSKNPFILKT